MKMQVLPLLFMCLLMTVFTPQVLPAATATVPPTAASAEATQLLQRLDELKAMDKSNLSRAEKKALRQEVRAVKSELREIGGGVYLSVGAIIIIVLLLILLL